MPRSILVVDDDAGTREVLSAILTDLGYDVQTAADGQLALDALALYAAPRPRVVLLDMQMPTMSGAEFLKVLATSGRLATLHVIVISGHAHEALKLGAKRVFRKPLSVAALLSAVREGCGETEIPPVAS